jgi:excisionase family DNA binding protein
MEDIRKYLTVPEVAEQLGLTQEWIRDLIRMKQIKAVKIGQWKINPKDIEAFIKSRMNVR